MKTKLFKACVVLLSLLQKSAAAAAAAEKCSELRVENVQEAAVAEVEPPW